jgi:hypothetical protein
MMSLRGYADGHSTSTVLRVDDKTGFIRQFSQGFRAVSLSCGFLPAVFSLTILRTVVFLK